MIALVGDHSLEVTAHRAIPLALEFARTQTGCHVEWQWVGTETLDDACRSLEKFSAVWLVPASPYRSTAGALGAVRFARESGRPFLGTCGGFQHALIEIARDVAGLADAAHAETDPNAHTLVVTPLACSLVEQSEEITFAPGSAMHTIFGGRPARGDERFAEGKSAEYHCRFGPTAAFRPVLEAAGVRFTGFDVSGEIRAMELPAHPFFCATLFQPERSGLRGEPHPLIEAFVRAAAAAVATQHGAR